MSLFGTDMKAFAPGSTGPDLDPTFSLINGAEVVGDAVARRLVTPRGSLLHDPDYGFDLRGMLNARMTPQQLAYIRNGVEKESTKDERVLSAKVQMSFSMSLQRLKVKVSLETKNGPFSLTLLVSDVSVELLRESI
jgi:hypothetical protein